MSALKSKKKMQQAEYEAKCGRAKECQRVVEWCNERLEDMKLEKLQIIKLKTQMEHEIANPCKQHESLELWDLEDENTRRTLLRFI